MTMLCYCRVVQVLCAWSSLRALTWWNYWFAILVSEFHGELGNCYLECRKLSVLSSAGMLRFKSSIKLLMYMKGSCPWRPSVFFLAHMCEIFMVSGSCSLCILRWYLHFMCSDFCFFFLCNLECWYSDCWLLFWCNICNLWCRWLLSTKDLMRHGDSVFKVKQSRSLIFCLIVLSFIIAMKSGVPQMTWHLICSDSSTCISSGWNWNACCWICGEYGCRIWRYIKRLYYYYFFGM